MNTHRIYAIILRQFYAYTHSLDRLAGIFYWPLVELVLWGITSTFISSISPEFSNFVVMIVSGIIFWHVVWNAQTELSLGILDELWNKNLINLFATPLAFAEWLVALIIVGVLKLAVSLSFMSLVAFVLYKVSIVSFGIKLVPFIGLLLMSGWWAGFLIVSIILRFGTKMQIIAWAFSSVIAPFSAIYYPLSVLPEAARWISSVLPTSYIFEGMREVIATGHLDTDKLAISFTLNCVYIVLMALFLNNSFKKTLQKGLVKVF